jgi:putative spermidine/putrescine transport system ATP-binding protein
MAFLELRSLSKRFGNFLAVDDISVEVRKGEILSFLGPSGCGKTTTLNMIAGFLEPSAGSIVLDGRTLDNVQPADRGLGVVFQSYALFPHMTVVENVAFGMEMRRVARPERDRRVAEALELVRLGGFAQRYPAQLSGGQQQRVAVARALVIAPPVLLLDEPLSNLDAKLREEMQTELRLIQRRVGTTTILVTHDQTEAMAISDRIAVMNRGRIEQIGAPHEVYENPATAFVSSFLGKTNLMQGELVAAGAHGASEIDFGGRRFPVGGLLRREMPPGAIKLSLRPEKIRFVARGEANGHALEGRVRTRVFLGNHWAYEVDSPVGPLLIYQQNAAHPVPEGEQVAIGWDMEDMRVVEAGHG